MKNLEKIEKELLERINIILKEFENFEKAHFNIEGDIIIKRKYKKKKDSTVLTNIFKQIISNDLKKSKV